MLTAQHVASFIGHEPGKALFVGLYAIGSSKPLTREAFWRVPAYRELKPLGMRGFAEEENQETVLCFNLALTDFYQQWKGKLIIGWPPPERAWWRRAHLNEIPILAILEESALDSAMPDWNEIDFSWEQLGMLPTRWRAVLSQWRGIYLIFDQSDGKGYVGYGTDNILGRWLTYAASAMEEIAFCGSETLGTFASQLSSASRQTWILTRLFCLRVPGRSGFIRARPMGSTRIRVLVKC